MSGQSPVESDEIEEPVGLREKLKNGGKAIGRAITERVVGATSSGSAYVDICELRKANSRYVFRYYRFTEDRYLELVKYEKMGVHKEKEVGRSRRYSDVAYDEGMVNKIEDEGRYWKKLESKDSDITVYGQSDCQGKLTGNFKLITNEAGKEEHIKRYYRIKELRKHEI